MWECVDEGGGGGCIVYANSEGKWRAFKIHDVY